MRRPLGATHAADLLPAAGPREKVRVQLEDCRGSILSVPARTVVLQVFVEVVCPTCERTFYVFGAPDVVPRAVASA